MSMKLIIMFVVIFILATLLVFSLLQARFECYSLCEGYNMNYTKGNCCCKTEMGCIFPKSWKENWR